ncbi:hypothetical protein BC940DRAFT_295054 [Gongronella butleri]|nr:hypothetical protein BC940DRAFT_295054 [Gongronella butleri]
MLRYQKIPPPPEVALPRRDQYVLDKYTRRMKRWDELFKVCCCWIGWDVILDFIPVVGKVITLMFSLSMYRLACQADLPRQLREKMLWHITVDFLLGLIPILGIVLDAMYRAHSKNTRLLRRYLYERARANQENQINQTTAGLIESPPPMTGLIEPPPLPARKDTKKDE